MTTEPLVRKAVLIVDDHPLLRRGLTALIESDPDLIVCAEAGSCAEALDALCHRVPDLVIVDLELDGRGGLELISDIRERYPSLPILVLSMHTQAAFAERALRAGARGYVTKQEFDQTVLTAIRRVLAGGMFVSEKIEARFLETFLAGSVSIDDSPLHRLSDRELEVFRAIGRGRTTRQIAADFHLSIKTIESHREHIKQKLGLTSSAEMAQRATQWVESGQDR